MVPFRPQAVLIEYPKAPAATRVIDDTIPEVNETELVLVLARKSRGADKDDYDVRLGDASGPVVGRIMRHPQANDVVHVVDELGPAIPTRLNIARN
jgi:hypothetical protein